MRQEGDLLGTPKPFSTTFLRLLENSSFCLHCPQIPANDSHMALVCHGGLHLLFFESRVTFLLLARVDLTWPGALEFLFIDGQDVFA